MNLPTNEQIVNLIDSLIWNLVALRRVRGIQIDRLINGYGGDDRSELIAEHYMDNEQERYIIGCIKSLSWVVGNDYNYDVPEHYLTESGCHSKNPNNKNKLKEYTKIVEQLKKGKL